MCIEMKFNNAIDERFLSNFNKLLSHYYFLRREKALEEGRKIFAKEAPSRLHSIFLTDKVDLQYWKDLVGKLSFKVFMLELKGNLFVSSDMYFPDSKLMYDIQVEKSKEYWKPKKLTLRKEFVFQGECVIKGECL